MVKITFLPKIASARDFLIKELILMWFIKIEEGGDGKQYTNDGFRPSFV